jgi:hypothetical protein
LIARRSPLWAGEASARSRHQSPRQAILGPTAASYSGVLDQPPGLRQSLLSRLFNYQFPTHTGSTS